MRVCVRSSYLTLLFLAWSWPAVAEDGAITKTWAIAEFGDPLHRDGFTH